MSVREVIKAHAARLSGRKLRLFAAAGWRLLGNHIYGDSERAAAKRDYVASCAEIMADGKPAPADCPKCGRHGDILYAPTNPDPLQAALSIASLGGGLPGFDASLSKALDDLMIGPYLPPVSVGRDALAVARDMYDRKALEELPVLADALEDAGLPATELCRSCSGDGLLRGVAAPVEGSRCPYCRGEGRRPTALFRHLRCGRRHFRGCWALDFVLGLS